MTAEELKQLKSLKAEVEHIAKEIVSIKPKYVTDCVKDYRSGYARSVTIEGYSTWESDKLRKKLEIRQHELEKQVYRLEEWLDLVEDSDMRQILRLRYRSGLTWNEIAARMGYDYSVDGIKKKHQRFLKKI